MGKDLIKNINVKRCEVRVEKIPKIDPNKILSPRDVEKLTSPRIDPQKVLSSNDLKTRPEQKVDKTKTKHEQRPEIIKKHTEEQLVEAINNIEQISDKIEKFPDSKDDKTKVKPESKPDAIKTNSEEKSEKIKGNSVQKSTQGNKTSKEAVTLKTTEASDQNKAKDPQVILKTSSNVSGKIANETEAVSEIKDQKKKRKRKPNKTGFPSTKKKKKPISTIENGEKTEVSPSKRSRKATKTEKNKKVHLPLRVSSRIIPDQKSQSDTDSRPNSRLESYSSTTVTSNQKEQISGLSNKESEENRPPIKRSKLYEDVDENIDCLALLPTNDMEIENDESM